MIAGVTAPPRWQWSSASGTLRDSGRVIRPSIAERSATDRSGPQFDVPRAGVKAVRVGPAHGEGIHTRLERAPFRPIEHDVRRPAVGARNTAPDRWHGNERGGREPAQ